MSGMVVRRIKTHVAQTGYVYQYYFVGKRPALDGTQSTEYVFDVTCDRKTMFAVSVFVGQDALKNWAGQHGRPLTETEQYASAKLCLQQGFDTYSDMISAGRRLVVDSTNVEELLEALDLS
jgi:hypothetical protein